MVKLMLSWREIEFNIREIDAWLKAIEFKPNVIVGINRGGIVPARLLSDRLGVTKIVIISASRYKYGEQEKTEGSIVLEDYPPFEDGSTILVVDDIWDTGETIRKMRSHICKHSVNTIQLKFVTLVSKTPGYSPELDYTPVVMSPDSWVVFPWDKHEFTNSRRVLPTC